jgi:hypothetical protein
MDSVERIHKELESFKATKRFEGLTANVGEVYIDCSSLVNVFTEENSISTTFFFFMNSVTICFRCSPTEGTSTFRQSWKIDWKGVYWRVLTWIGTMWATSIYGRPWIRIVEAFALDSFFAYRLTYSSPIRMFSLSENEMELIERKSTVGSFTAVIQHH